MLLTKYDNQRTGISVIHLFHALAYFFFPFSIIKQMCMLN